MVVPFANSGGITSTLGWRLPALFGTEQVKFSGFDLGMRSMAPKMQPKANDGFQEQEQQLQAPGKPSVQDPTVFVESRTTGGAGSVAESTAALENHIMPPT